MRLKKKYLPEESLGFDKEGIEELDKKGYLKSSLEITFGIPVIKEYRWIDTYDADRYSLLLESYSSPQTLDEEHKKLYLSEVRDYINSNGGVVEMPQHVMLYLVKRIMDKFQSCGEIESNRRFSVCEGEGKQYKLRK